MAKPYKLLKGEIFANDMTQNDIAATIGRSQNYVTQRMTGKKPWTMQDAYAICDALEIPHEKMHRYFPPEGSPCST
jgi:cyanate lyase